MGRSLCWILPRSPGSVNEALYPWGMYSQRRIKRRWQNYMKSQLIIWFHIGVCALITQSCPTVSDPSRLLCPWNSPGKNTRAACHFLLPGIFLTQGSEPSLMSLQHWQVDSLPLSHLGSRLSHQYQWSLISVKKQKNACSNIQNLTLISFIFDQVNVMYWQFLELVLQEDLPRVIRWNLRKGYRARHECSSSPFLLTP